MYTAFVQDSAGIGMNATTNRSYRVFHDARYRYPESSFEPLVIDTHLLRKDISSWFRELHDMFCFLRFGSIHDGSSYAPELGQFSVYYTHEFLNLLLDEGVEPDHMGYSALGGMGFTFLNEAVEYVVEFLDEGIILETVVRDEADPGDAHIDRIRDANPCEYILQRLRDLDLA